VEANSYAHYKTEVNSSLLSYIVTAQDALGNDTKTHPVVIKVPSYKVNMLTNYFVAALSQGQFTAIGLLASGIPIVGLPAFAIEALSLAYGCSAYNTAGDPDPNFMTIATAQPISLPAVDNLPDSPGKQLATAWKQVIVDQTALSVTLGRYEGAKAAGNVDWTLSQLQAARGFHTALMQDLSAVSQLTNVFITHLQSRGLVLTQSALAVVKQQLLSQGLPPTEQSILGQLGLTPNEISTATQATAGLTDFAPLNWEATLTSGIAGTIAETDRIGAWIDQQITLLSTRTLSLDFDSVNASNAFQGIPADSYLAGFGITIGAVTPSTSVVILNNNNVYGGGPILPLHLPTSSPKSVVAAILLHLRWYFRSPSIALASPGWP
jgi:hypothetical protein